MATTKQSCIAIQMGSDGRVPANAYGYISDIIADGAAPSFVADRLNMLDRYVPDLVAEFRATLAAAALGALGGKVKSEKKSKSNAENGKKGGWPKGKPRKTPSDSTE